MADLGYLHYLLSLPLLPGETRKARAAAVRNAAIALTDDATELSDGRLLELVSEFFIRDLDFDRPLIRLPDDFDILDDFPKLPHFLCLPLLPGETRAARLAAIRDAIPKLSDGGRLENVLEFFIRELDVDDALIRLPYAPGILANFAKLHPWLWRPVGKRPGKFTNDAHSEGLARFHHAWLIEEMEKRVKAIGKRGAPLQAAWSIVKEEYVGTTRNVWFVPPRNSVMTRKDGVDLILEFFKNRKRMLERIEELERQDRARAAARPPGWGDKGAWITTRFSYGRVP